VSSVDEELGKELRRLKTEDPERLYEILNQLSEEEVQDILYDPEIWLRENQKIHDEWSEPIIMILAGRGFGKSHASMSWLRKKVRAGLKGEVTMIAPTNTMIRDTLVFNTLLPWCHPEKDGAEYEPSKSRVVFKNGATVRLISAENGSERIRGANNELIVIDELGSIDNPDMFNQAMLSLRVGQSKCLITTTPRPTKTIIDLYNRAVFDNDPPQKGKDVRILRGRTSDNFQNLSEAFRNTIIKAYEGTSLERQELHGELLLEAEGALWSRELIKNQTMAEDASLPTLERVAIGVDPAVSTGKFSDSTGIVVAAQGSDERGYVLGDFTGKYTVEGWSDKVVGLYDHYSKFAPTSVVVESNMGGNLLTDTLQRNRPFLPIDTTYSTNSKINRAQPIALLYEQGKVFHVKGLTDLENEFCSFTGSPRERSPDRMDAAVFALTTVMPVRQSFARVSSLEL